MFLTFASLLEKGEVNFFKIGMGHDFKKGINIQNQLFILFFVQIR